MKKLAVLFSISRKQFAFATQEEILNQTGYEVGVLTPLCVEKNIEIILDSSFKGKTEIMCGAGVHHATVRIPRLIFEKMLRYRYYDLCK